MQAEALYNQFKTKKEVLQGKTKEQVMSKYGSAAKQPDEEVLALAQSEAYTEYNAEVGHHSTPFFRILAMSLRCCIWDILLCA